MNYLTEELIHQHLPLARRLARKKSRTISCVGYDELESAAFFGLVLAAKNYDSSKNICFAAFASFRIKGAIQDYLRELQWGSRSKPLTSEPNFEFISKVFPDEETFTEIIVELPENNQRILRMYYQKNRTLKEIALEVNLSLARVHQILQESHVKIQTRSADELWSLVA